MIEKNKIGVDIDEVVLEFFTGYLGPFNQKFNTNFRFEDVTNYHFWEVAGVPKEDCLALAHEIHLSENQHNVKLVDGVKDALAKISRDYEIYFITSRPKEYEDIMIKTLTGVFNDFKFKLFFSSGVWGSNKTKGEICKELGIGIMVEDNTDYALTCAEAGVKTFLMDKPWNQGYNQNKNLIKVKSWKEILHHLDLK